MAYITVYGREPNPSIYGREASHDTYNFHGIGIDKMIPIRSMEKISRIREIETTSSCQGQSERLLTFLVFRPKNQSKNYVDQLCNNLKKTGLKCHYDIGQAGKFRICVSEKLWYSKENASKFKQWWTSLPEKIIQSLKKIRNVKEDFNVNVQKARITPIVSIKNYIIKKSKHMGMHPRRFMIRKFIHFMKSFWFAGLSYQYKTSPKDVDEHELMMGIKVEYEHTTNRKIAAKIALDHLTEIDDYYTRLEKMEEQAKREGHFKIKEND